MCLGKWFYHIKVELIFSSTSDNIHIIFRSLANRPKQTYRRHCFSMQMLNQKSTTLLPTYIMQILIFGVTDLYFPRTGCVAKLSCNDRWCHKVRSSIKNDSIRYQILQVWQFIIADMRNVWFAVNIIRLDEIYAGGDCLWCAYWYKFWMYLRPVIFWIGIAPTNLVTMIT